MQTNSKPVPEDLIDFIRSGSNFVVAGHEEPDGDCVGSQLALCSLLRRMGKKAVPCSAGPFVRTELKAFEKHFLPFPVGRDGLKLIVVDCSLRERVGNLPIEGLPAAVVDHHASGEEARKPKSSNPAEKPPNLLGDVVFLDSAAPAVSFMMEKIFSALGETPTKEEAELLFFGLCTDTGFFRHLEETSAETFLTAARLCAAGASPRKIYGIMNGGKSLNSRLLLGAILARTRSYFDGKLLLSNETLEESQRFGHESRDSDMLYRVLQSVENVEAVALIRQETAQEFSLGLRSRDTIDVAAIAESFGGGGHKNAAGAKVQGTMSKLEEKIAAAFAKWF